MALGSTTGECALLTQNNNNTYFGSIIFGLDKIVSTNLIGDPALRSFTQTPANPVRCISFFKLVTLFGYS